MDMLITSIKANAAFQCLQEMQGKSEEEVLNFYRYQVRCALQQTTPQLIDIITEQAEEEGLLRLVNQQLKGRRQHVSNRT